MTKRLSADTCEEIRLLSRKISVAHELDAEIQEELYGHMEDKLIAYLDGGETLSEEDGLILVREHFGNPSAVKGLLQDVHACEAGVSLARRLGVALIFTEGLNVFLIGFAQLANRMWLDSGGSWGVLASLGTALALHPIVLWFLLWRSQRRLDEGHTPWFLTWRPAHFIVAVAILWVFRSLGTYFWPSGMGAVGPAILVASVVLRCAAWLWWCDRPPRKARAVSTAAGFWVVCTWFSSLLASVDSVMGLTDSSLQQVALGMAGSLLYLLAFALVTILLYWMAKKTTAGLSRWSGAGSAP